MTRIQLSVPELTDEERGLLKQLLVDALGEFQYERCLDKFHYTEDVEKAAAAYVIRRYYHMRNPTDPTERGRYIIKCREVASRLRLATKIKRAVFDSLEVK